MLKTSTILVDRLAHGLSVHGVKLKRRALLETAASAFGYRNSNAFTAASAAGDIAPAPVTVIGRIELPCDQTLIVVQDPLANAPYAIDASFIEAVVEEERREQIGITPYGNLVALNEVASVPLIDMASQAPVSSIAASADANGLITIAREDLARLLSAAENYHEDISTGITEGIYEADQNPDLGELRSAINTVEARLALEALPPASACAEAQTNKVPVYIARVVHKHGSDIYAAFSAEDRDRQLSIYCKENWSEIVDEDSVPENFAGMSDREITSLYFGIMQDNEREWVEEEVIQLDKPDFLPAVVASTSPKGANYHDLATILTDGTVADVWYDAHEFGGDDEDDADRIAERKIDTIKHAMVEAAAILRSLPEALANAPSRKPVTTCVRCDSQLRSNGLCSDETCGFSGFRQDHEKGWSGHPDAAEMIAAQRLERQPVVITDSDGYGASTGVSLDPRETDYALHGLALNSHLDHPFKLGMTVLHAEQKWLAAMTDIGWDLDEADGSVTAMGKAVAFMQHLDPLIEKLGGWTRLKPNACEFSHELTVYLPMALALESDTPEDWQAALAYLLLTEQEKEDRKQVTCEFTAEVDVRNCIMSVDPLGDTTWDATFDALRWGADNALHILLGGGDADDYAFSPLAPDWVGEWCAARPFTVEPIGLKEALNLAI